MHQYPAHEPGHTYGPGFDIRWQDGAIGRDFNGATVEGVIRAVLHRMDDFQALLPCEENRQVIEHLNAALGCLDSRTRDRYRRGVMGTAAL
jgi:hypothetical protein